MSTQVKAVVRPTAEDIFANAEDKQLWSNVTLKDIMNYYISVAKYIIPHLRDKVQSLRRDTFSKDGGPIETIVPDRGPWPEWVETAKVYSAHVKEIKDYIICNNVETLLYLNTIGSIETNPWLSKYYVIEKPDSLVIDLDPSEQNTFENVIEVANVVKGILDSAGVKSYPKTSGSSGIHIYVPVGGLYEYEKVRRVAQVIAEKTVSMIPGLTTIERKLAVREKNKIYVDYMQNKRGSTLAAVYGVRPRKEPYVSMPLHWEEVKPGLHPSQFSIYNALQKIESNGGDIFYPVLSDRTDLNKVLNILN
jgi:bifunctional non-homologous end joining protein LigD